MEREPSARESLPRSLNFAVRRRNMTLRLRSALCLIACAIAACDSAPAPSAKAAPAPRPEGVLVYLGTTAALECFDSVLTNLKVRHDITRQPLGTPTPVATIRWYPSGNSQQKQVACYVNACMGSQQCDK